MKAADKKEPLYIFLGVGVILFLLLCFLGYLFFDARREVVSLENTLEGLSETNKILEERIILEREKGEGFLQTLQEEQTKNNSFEKQIYDIASTVGVLDKLSKTDEELLQKYSKVYFLNENYIPEKLAQTDLTYSYNTGKDLYFHAKALRFLNELMGAASRKDVELFIVSAYRSFDTQSGLKSNYSVKYGSGANAFSADQGYSEHQLGTTVDFTSREVGASLNGFEKTSEYQWLVDNAHLYGFVLSYPEKNAYYVFEPWHWRFVGTKLARHLHDTGKYFYDMDQREIDQYLVSIFD